MKGSNKSILNLFAFLAFSVLAILIVLTGLDKVGVHIFGSTVLNVLETVRNICVLVVLGCMSYNFVKTCGKFLKIVFIVAVCVFVAGTIMTWL